MPPRSFDDNLMLMKGDREIESLYARAVDDFRSRHARPPDRSEKAVLLDSIIKRVFEARARQDRLNRQSRVNRRWLDAELERVAA
jgi:hypothetical protein